MTGRMEVLIDGEWVDVSNTVQSVEFAPTAGVDSAAVDEGSSPLGDIVELSVSVDPADGARLFAMLRESEQRARAERARRRLWLRFPYRGRGLR